MTEHSAPTVPCDLTAVAQGQRAMMRRFPTGVAVVTAFDDVGAPRGMTVSSMCSLSLDPPALLICLRFGSPTLEAIQHSGRFAVNLLHGGARTVAELFASGAPNRFERVYWIADPGHRTFSGPHLCHAAHAIADCRVMQAERAGDHVVVFGETLQVTEHPSPPPLVYASRKYQSWPDDEPIPDSAES
jgi:flavin reductase (NADH)